MLLQVRATVTCEDGKIVCVQKAKKEGQKSTKVIKITIIMMLLMIKVMVGTEEYQSYKLFPRSPHQNQVLEHFWQLSIFVFLY